MQNPDGRRRHRVVQPAREVHRVLRLPAPHRLRRRHRLPGDQRGRLVHPGERRIVHACPARTIRSAEPRIGRRADGPHRRSPARCTSRSVESPRAWPRTPPPPPRSSPYARTSPMVSASRTGSIGWPGPKSYPVTASSHISCARRSCPPPYRAGSAPERTGVHAASPAPAPSARASPPGSSTRRPARPPAANRPGSRRS